MLCPKSILGQLPPATQILTEHNKASLKASFTLKVFKKAVIDSDGIYYWSAAIHYAANDSLSSSIVNKGGARPHSTQGSCIWAFTYVAFILFEIFMALCIFLLTAIYKKWNLVKILGPPHASCKVARKYWCLARASGFLKLGVVLCCGVLCTTCC